MKSKFTSFAALAAVLLSLFAAPAFADGFDPDAGGGVGPSVAGKGF
jgi:hypothetical protein